MGSKLISLVAIALVYGWAAVASAEDKGNPSSAVSIIGMTLQTFEGLPADAMIEVNGQRMTKIDFIARKLTAIMDAEQKMQEAAARAETDFQAQRKAFLASQEAKLKEANEKAQAVIARAIAADAAAHGANWKATQKQAFELLDRAGKASGKEQKRLVTEALHLLSPASPH